MTDKAKELIKEYRKLSKKADKLLQEHKDPESYYSVRRKMDKIEEALLIVYDMDIRELEY